MSKAIQLISPWSLKALKQQALSVVKRLLFFISADFYINRHGDIYSYFTYMLVDHDKNCQGNIYLYFTYVFSKLEYKPPGKYLLVFYCSPFQNKRNHDINFFWRGCRPYGWVVHKLHELIMSDRWVTFLLNGREISNLNEWKCKQLVKVANTSL